VKRGVTSYLDTNPLGVSKDSIIGVDQTARTFQSRITTNYNMYHGELKEKIERQLKS